MTRQRWIRVSALGIGAVALAALLVMPVTRAAAGDRALVVAIGAYPNEIGPLAGPPQDAQAMRALLTQRLDYDSAEVKVLRDEDATRAAILRAIDDWLIGGSKPGSRALLYFSGHGAQLVDTSGDEDDGLDEIIVPVDARLGRSTGRDPTPVMNAIIDDEIGQRLQELRDRNVVVIVDSCNSGTVTRSIGDASAVARSPAALRRAAGASRMLDVQPTHSGGHDFVDAQGSGRLVVWTAVSAYQLALDDIEAEPVMGVFTRRFVAAIESPRADRNGDSQTTHVELLDWLRAESEAYCARQPRHCRSGLTPLLDDDGLLLQPVETSLLGKPPVSVTPSQAAAYALAPGGKVRLTVHADDAPATRNLVGGQSLFMTVTSDFDGYLTLFDLHSDGSLHQFFPTMQSQSASPSGLEATRIMRGESRDVPDAYDDREFLVSEPWGPGVIVALVTEDPVDLSQAHRFAQTRMVEVVPTGNAAAATTTPAQSDGLKYLEIIAAKLRQVWQAPDADRPTRWAAAAFHYDAKQR